MTITTAGTSAATTSADTGIAAASKTSADFNLFLKMLTTQMQNQDPLKPMDSTEYTQQLAQYSQVEQTVQQTSTLKDILTQLSTQNLAQASGFIGREGNFDSAVSGLSGGTGAQWGYKADRALASLTATIKDAGGKVVETRALDTSTAAGTFAWDGTRTAGGKAADGAYTLSLAGADINGAAVPVSISSIGTVKEVVGTGGTVTLGVNGVQFPVSALQRMTSAS
jgi:flagellar basal-body rod modification protein FlgD